MSLNPHLTALIADARHHDLIREAEHVHLVGLALRGRRDRPGKRPASAAGAEARSAERSPGWQPAR